MTMNVGTLGLPSRKLTYPPKNGILKMIFLFPRWDMLIPWRVCFFCKGVYSFFSVFFWVVFQPPWSDCSRVKGSPVIFEGWHRKIASQNGWQPKTRRKEKYIYLNLVYTKYIAPLVFSDMFFLEIVYYSHLKEKGLKDITVNFHDPMCFREQ